MIDSHAHLYFDRFDEDRPAVIDRAQAAGIAAVINIGIDLGTSRQALDLAREYPGFCWATAGLHPTECALEPAELARVVDSLRELFEAHSHELRAVGEIGLDYHWDRTTPEQQDRAFRAQLELAAALSRPVVIHCREAMPAALAVVDEWADRVRGVFHCFAGTAEEARRVLELGWCISFCGNVTYPKAHELREAAEAAGPEKLLLETDAPFLAPQAVRGQRNEPAHVVHTRDFLAQLFGMPVDDLVRRTTAATRELFQLPQAAPP